MKQQQFKILIEAKYCQGVYSIEDLMKFVDIKELTKEEFHSITSYSYDGLKRRKEEWGW